MQDTLLNHVQNLTFYASALVALIAGLVLFARTRKVGFLLLGIVALVSLVTLLLSRLLPQIPLWVITTLLILMNVGQLVAWLILAAEFMFGHNRSVPAVAGTAAPVIPVCPNCNTPLVAASRFCVKCGQATGI